MHTNEEWRQVVGYEGLYSVSNHGRVRSERRVVRNTARGSVRVVGQRVLRARPDGGGYLYVRLSNENEQRVVKVASLVAAAFIGPRPSGADVCHADGNRVNNAPANLRYGTRAENMADAMRHGTVRKGENHRSSKLTEAAVRAIRADTRTLAAIAADWKLSFQHVSAIRNRKAWAHV